MNNTDEQQKGNKNEEVKKNRLGAFRSVFPFSGENKVDVLILEDHQADEMFVLMPEDHFYRKLVEEMNEGALILADDGTIIYCNRSFAAMVELSPNMLVERTFWDIVHPDDRPFLLAELERKSWKSRHEISLICSGGTYLPVLFSINCIYIKGEQRLAVTITDLSKLKEHDLQMKLTNQLLSREINERIQIEEELRKSEEEKIDVLENISDGFCTLDSQLYFTYANRMTEKIINCSCQEMIGLKIDEAFTGISPETIEVFENVNREKVPTQMEMETLPPHNRWLDISVYPNKNGISVFFRDITGQKKMEADLRQSERKFFKIFHEVPIMMSIVAFKDDTFLDVNEALCLRTGYTHEDFIGHTEKTLNLFSDEVLVLLKAQLEKGGRIDKYEVTLHTKSGRMLNCLCWSRLLYLDHQLCRISGLVDITEKKFLEREMARLDRLNLVGEMAASIGHEIRNPMTSIRGFVQLLSEKECYKQDRLYFDLMIEELDRANSIISEYLGLAGTKGVNLEIKNLDVAIRSIFPILVADANYQEKIVKLDLNDPPLVLIDEKAIRQLIFNMVRNGLEAMDSGGILEIGTGMEDGHIILWIKDEGSGLEPGIIDKLGTPFTTTKENGTGLGLAVCYSIAAQHNAKIDYETGKSGTKFKVIFPIAEQISLF